MSSCWSGKSFPRYHIGESVLTSGVPTVNDRGLLGEGAGYVDPQRSQSSKLDFVTLFVRSLRLVQESERFDRGYRLRIPRVQHPPKLNPSRGDFHGYRNIDCAAAPADDWR